MEKISPPLRIAIVAVLLFAVAWFLVLRPKPAAEEPATTAPGMTGLANDVKRAEGATAAANAAASRAQNAAANVEATQGAATATKTTTKSATATTSKGTTVTATKTTTEKAVATKPKPAAKPKAAAPAKAKAKADPAAPLVAALNDGKAVILLFRSRSSDSQAVADAVRAVPKQVKRVVVRVAPIGQVGRYATFTEKTQIAQAPTVLIIGPGRRAKVIVGYTSTAEVAEAVRDLRRSGK